MAADPADDPRASAPGQAVASGDASTAILFGWCMSDEQRCRRIVQRFGNVLSKVVGVSLELEQIEAIINNRTALQQQALG